MTLNFILNGKDVSVNCRPDQRVSSLLREHFDLIKVKNGCYNGQCGSCSIILNNRLVSSCLVPAFALKEAEVMTEEGFAKLAERKQILRALKKNDAELCDYCQGGRLMAIHSFLEKSPKGETSSDEEILSALSGNRCNCIDPYTLIEVVKECQMEGIRKRHVFKR